MGPKWLATRKLHFCSKFFLVPDAGEAPVHVRAGIRPEIGWIGRMGFKLIHVLSGTAHSALSESLLTAAQRRFSESLLS